jgi:hypothetical protein
MPLFLPTASAQTPALAVALALETQSSQEGESARPSLTIRA